MSRSLPLALTLVFAAAALNAQTPTPQTNSMDHASMQRASSVPHEPSACADLHKAMGAGHPQLDSAQMAAIHATIHQALASGISIDSVHQMLMGKLSNGQSAPVKLTASQKSAIQACVTSVQHEQQAKQR